MITRAQIEKNLLRALNAGDGVPFPQSALVQAVTNLSRPDQPTMGDVLDALRSAEGKKLVAGVSDPDGINETTWTLTDKGRHKARE